MILSEVNKTGPCVDAFSENHHDNNSLSESV